jgi:hypothetical protein
MAKKAENKPFVKRKYIDTPDNLLKIWDEYKEYIDNNPDVQEIATGKGVMVIRVKKPYQKVGFESFVFRNYGFNVHQYIDNYKGAYDSYLGVVTCMRREWEEDQIEGTLTGRYKAPNLVARLNNIAERTENKHEVSEIKITRDR